MSAASFIVSNGRPAGVRARVRRWRGRARARAHKRHARAGMCPGRGPVVARPGAGTPIDASAP